MATRVTSARPWKGRDDKLGEGEHLYLIAWQCEHPVEGVSAGTIELVVNAPISTPADLQWLKPLIKRWKKMPDKATVRSFSEFEV